VLKSKSGFQPLGFDSAPNSILRQAREATQYPYFFSRFALNFAQRAFWGAAIFREPWPKEYGATRLRTSRPPIYPARREPRPRGEGYLLDVLFPLSIPRQYFPNPLSLGMNELYRILRHRYYSSPEETLTFPNSTFVPFPSLWRQAMLLWNSFSGEEPVRAIRPTTQTGSGTFCFRALKRSSGGLTVSIPRPCLAAR
jgi:hypothetical protein